MNVQTRCKHALWRKFEDTTPNVSDKNGYVGAPEYNLISDVRLEVVQDDLLRGDGNELGGKFRAVHSSCALAINSFGPFKVNPSNLNLLGVQGAKRVEFEWPLPIFDGGRPANLDVWIEREGDIVAVESKLLEYLASKRPAFSNAYERLAPECEPCWWVLYKDVRGGAEQFLDRAQLIKHYFGLNTYRNANSQASLTLLYIFWEPLNWQTIPECKQHRDELCAFAKVVSNSEIAFRWMSYNDLWQEWTAIPAIADHAKKLKERYQVSLAAEA